VSVVLHLKLETYATVDPINQTMGRNENTLALFDSSVSSLIAIFTTLEFPFNPATSARLKVIPRNDFERPKRRMEKASPNVPITSTGLRPIRPEKWPHRGTNEACVRKKTDSCDDGKQTTTHFEIEIRTTMPT
jgi:hypothetical protein